MEKEFFHWVVSPFKKKKNNQNERQEEGIKKSGGITHKWGTGCVWGVCGVRTGYMFFFFLISSLLLSPSSSSSSSSSTTKSFDKEKKKKPENNQKYLRLKLLKMPMQDFTCCVVCVCVFYFFHSF